MNKCDKCKREVEVNEYKVTTFVGTDYKNLCDECVAKYVADSDVTIEKMNPETGKYDSEIVPQNQEFGGCEQNKTLSVSSVLNIIAWIIAIIGALSGLITGIESPVMKMVVMLSAWIGTAILFFIFWGLSNILKNQEKILEALENTKEVKETDGN